MLVFQADQIAALADTQLDGFVGRATRFVHEHFPDLAHAYGDESIAAHARLAVGRGALYGMSGERHITQILVLMLLLGSDFDTRLPEGERLQRVLADAERSPDDRLDQVFVIVEPLCAG